MICAWKTPQTECDFPKWVLAWICDRCETDGVQEVCDKHYDALSCEGKFRAGCGECGGTLSWAAERMDGSMTAEAITTFFTVPIVIL